MQNGWLRAAVAFAVVIVGLLDGCALLGKGVQPPISVPVPPFIARLVADALGEMAFHANLMALHEVGSDDDRKLLQSTLQQLALAEYGTDLSSAFDVHIVDLDRRPEARAFPGGGILVSSEFFNCPEDILRSEADGGSVVARAAGVDESGVASESRFDGRTDESSVMRAACEAHRRGTTPAMQAWLEKKCQALLQTPPRAAVLAQTSSSVQTPTAAPSNENTKQGGCKLRPDNPNESIKAVLAVALSHEIFHVERGHFAARLENNAAVVFDKVVRVIMEEIRAGRLTQDPKHILKQLKNMTLEEGSIAFLVGTIGLTTHREAGGHPYMVPQEIEADCLGVALMSKAKLHPENALAFWSNNESAFDASAGIPTHPTTAERKQRLSACIASLPANVTAANTMSAHRGSR